MKTYLFVDRASRRIPAVSPAPAPDPAAPAATPDQPAAQREQRALAPVRMRKLDVRARAARARPRALLRARSVHELRVAHGEVALEGEHDVAEDGAAEGDVVHGVEGVDEEAVVGGGGEVEGLDEGELGHGGEEVGRVEGRHGDEELVEDAQHLGPGEHVDADLRGWGGMISGFEAGEKAS